MAGITKEQLRKEINAILKDADLTEMSAKKVRQQLEKNLSCDLTNRKKEVDELVMDFVNPKEKDVSEDDEEEDSEEEEEEDPSDEEPKKVNKRAPPAKKQQPSKMKKKNTSDEESASNSDGGNSDEEYSPRKGGGATKATPKSGKKAGGGRKRKGSDSDSDEDWKKPKKQPRKAGAAKGKGTGFTRAYTLSPDLAHLMGTNALPRHEVVKKMWAMIKERNLYDPKNKQYAICDSDLLKVIGVKRFRTFGMLKYLRPHFLD